MRTRTRSNPYGFTSSGPWTSQHVDTSTGAVVSTSSGTSTSKPLGSSTEIITDQIRGPDGTGFVEHSKVDFKVRPCMMGSWHYAGKTRRIDITSGSYSMWNDIGLVIGEIPMNKIKVSYPKSKEQLMTAAQIKFNDVNETDNLLNLIEAGQTVATMQSFLDLSKRYIFAKDYGSFLSWKGRRKFVGDITNAHLGWSFGFAPLISDLRKIGRSLPILRKNLRMLAARSAKLQTVTEKCDGTLSVSYADLGLPFSAPDDAGGMFDVRLLPTTCTLTAGIRGLRSLKYETAAFQQADYLMRRFIATGPVSLAWEKVPFSFAIDWVVNLHGLIDLLDNTLADVGKSVKRSWFSEQKKFLLVVNKHKSGDNDWPDDGNQVALGDYSYYLRQTLPTNSSVGWAGKFGKKQFGLTASLLYQKIANLRNR